MRFRRMDDDYLKLNMTNTIYERCDMKDDEVGGV